MSTAEIDEQIERFHKAEGADDHSQHVEQNQHLNLGDAVKSPFILAIGALALALVLESVYFGYELGTARADAQEAKAFGHQAEREAKLSREDVKNLDIHNQVLTALLQSRGFNPPPPPKLHQESQ